MFLRGQQQTLPNGKTVPDGGWYWHCDCSVKVSDIPVRTSAVAMQADEANVADLITFWTQLPPQRSLLDDSRAMMVPKEQTCCVDNLHKSRLHTVFASKLINADSGEIDWSKGVYSPTWNADGKLVRASHRSGDFVTSPVGAIDEPWQLEVNVRGWHAKMVCPPLPPLKLYTLVKKMQRGPYMFPHRPGPQNTKLREIVVAFVADRQKQRGGGPAPMQHLDIKEDTALAKRTVKQDRASKARAAATHALAQQRARTALTSD